ncbi:hypothetical protein [Nesterenkonia sp. Act20]|uniref:hypothetical protein n=1 Tax=Nesterenkonia sp. Act20 TaxID=1483432 RepID=UPI001C47641B|nr:hypothetical protein [Nesterenkonia sp. Act20]
MASKYSISILAVAGLVLASSPGCSAESGPASGVDENSAEEQSVPESQTFTDLEQDPENERAVPDSVPDRALDHFDRDATRWVGEYKGTQLWLGMAKDDTGPCLLSVPRNEDWLAGCGGGQVQISGGGRVYIAVPDDAEQPRNSTPVSTNVFARGD